MILCYQSTTNNMILTTVLILSFLVALNFVLLIFSCNKTSKTSENRKPRVVIKTNKKRPVITSNQLQTRPLAPTGS